MYRFLPRPLPALGFIAILSLVLVAVGNNWNMFTAVFPRNMNSPVSVDQPQPTRVVGQCNPQEAAQRWIEKIELYNNQQRDFNYQCQVRGTARASCYILNVSTNLRDADMDVIPEARADEIVRSMRTRQPFFSNDPAHPAQLPWGPQGFCFERASAVQGIMANMSPPIRTGKVFIVGELRFPDGSSNPAHAAVLTRVSTANGVQLRVIDPQIEATRSLTIDEWVARTSGRTDPMPEVSYRPGCQFQPNDVSVPSVQPASCARSHLTPTAWSQITSSRTGSAPRR